MHLFKFYVDEERWPVMQFKELAVHLHWLLRDKLVICLGKEDVDGKPMIPCGLPNPIPFRRLWGNDVPSSTGNPNKAREKVSKALVKRSFIKGGILGYIEFWECGMLECSGFQKDFPSYIEYWNGILAELEKPLPPTPMALVEGFWPIHDWRARDPTPLCLITSGYVTPKDDKVELYCGLRNKRPKDAFNPW